MQLQPGSCYLYTEAIPADLADFEVVRGNEWADALDMLANLAKQEGGEPQSEAEDSIGVSHHKLRAAGIPRVLLRDDQTPFPAIGYAALRSPDDQLQKTKPGNPILLNSQSLSAFANLLYLELVGLVEPLSFNKRIRFLFCPLRS